MKNKIMGIIVNALLKKCDGVDLSNIDMELEVPKTMFKGSTLSEPEQNVKVKIKIDNMEIKLLKK